MVDDAPAPADTADGTPAPPAAPEGEKNWREELPEDIREAAVLQKYNSVDDMAHAFINAEQLIGRDKIPMPKSDEEFMATYDRLGRPETAADYGIKAPELPEGMAANPDMEKAFMDTAHGLGLSTKQAAGINDWYYKSMITAHNSNAEQSNQSVQEAETALRETWGEGYDKMVAVANRAAAEFGGEEFEEFLVKSGMGRHPGFIKTFAAIGSKMMEDGNLDGQGVPVGRTTEQIQSEMVDLENDPAYLDKNHARHKFVVGQMAKLHTELTPVKQGV